MIIRISGEGQFRIPSSHLDRLEEIDNEIVTVVAAGKREDYQALFDSLLTLVRENGKPLDPDELLESQVVLPPSDTSFDEAEHLFVGEGLISQDEEA